MYSLFRTCTGRQNNTHQACYARARSSQYKLGSTCDLKTHKLKIQCLPGTVGTEGNKSDNYSSFTVRGGDDIVWRLLVYPCFFKVRYIHYSSEAKANIDCQG